MIGITLKIVSPHVGVRLHTYDTLVPYFGVSLVHWVAITIGITKFV